jgi:hypothetical protein
MFLKHRTSGKLIEVLSQGDLINPMHTAIIGRYHAGEELQEPERFDKADLLFASDESLPRCWTDVHYRDAAVHHYYKKAS